MLQYNNTVYELFEYIRGTGYDNSLDSTFDSGRILGLYHKLLRDYTPEYEPPVGSYHNSRAINGSLDQIPFTFSRSDRLRNVSQAEVSATVAFLRDAYVQAAARVNAAHLPDWPQQIVHGDWHPGNILFRNHRVVAVIDYDAARMQQRIIDLANGALQFSILGGTDDPATWPDYLDEARYKRFLRGYDSVDVISTAELEVLPSLMVEAMVAESALPIAATGSFGRIEGYGFLQMIERKVRWLLKHSTHLVELVAS
jgi:Ser/Thr protein kinase RdoA (MazF antagonist)